MPDPVAAAPVTEQSSQNDEDAAVVNVDKGAKEAKPVSDAPPATPAKKRFSVSEDGKFKAALKIKGKDQELDYDEETLVRDLQRGRYMSQEREEIEKRALGIAAEKEQAQAHINQSKALLEALKDPVQARQIYKAIGIDPVGHAKAWAKEYVEEQELDPRERAYRERERALAEKEEKYQKDEQLKAQEEETRQLESSKEQFATRLLGALKKSGFESDSAAGNVAVQRLAFKLRNSLKANLETTDEDLVESLREDYKQEHQSLYKMSSGKDLFELLGDDNLKKVNEYALSMVNGPKTLASPSAPGKKAPEASLFEGFKTAEEYFEHLRMQANAEEQEAERQQFEAEMAKMKAGN
jgi:hypothetical protein